jgi:hypothetical protein
MRKVYVQVTADFTPDGSLVPRSFVWEDGRTFPVDRVFECKKAVSLKVGGQGLRYRCRVSGREAYLFYEDGRWFMEGKDDEDRV